MYTIGTAQQACSNRETPAWFDVFSKTVALKSGAGCRPATLIVRAYDEGDAFIPSAPLAISVLSQSDDMVFSSYESEIIAESAGGITLEVD